MKIKHITLGVVIVAVIAAVVIWLYQPSESNNSNSNENPASHADQYTFDATIYQYDQQGRVQSVLHATKLVHLQAKNTTTLTDPVMTTYTSKRVSWKISAQHALMQYGVDVVYLWGEVVIHQLGNSDHPDTTITTTQATYHPKTSVIETTHSIKIVRPGMTLTAQGMTANLENGTVKTMSHSRGEYEPDKTH